MVATSNIKLIFKVTMETTATPREFYLNSPFLTVNLCHYTCHSLLCTPCDECVFHQHTVVEDWWYSRQDCVT